jgi:serine/threonine protein phosphatase PrpC
MDLSIGTKSDPGKRPNNEDYLAVMDPKKYGLRADSILIIADGMGGRNFGEKAAELATCTVQETLADLLRVDSPHRMSIPDALQASLHRANLAVFEVAQEDPNCEGMGTTCVVGVIEDSRLYLAYVGDSRAYFLRNGVLEQLTEDHSYVAEQVRAGLMTEEAARRSRFRNVITRAVGIEDRMVSDVAEYSLDGVDSVLLCTDGLTNMASEADIQEIIALAPTAEVAANWLVSLANRNGGLDNITVIFVRLDVTPENDLRGTLAPTDDLPEDAFIPEAERVKSGNARRLTMGLFAATFAATFLVAMLFYFGSVLLMNGYRFTPFPPFLVQPPKTFSSGPTIRLDALGYDAPIVIYKASRLRGTQLTRSADDGALTALTATGEVINISPGGRVLSKFSGGETPAPKTAHSNVHLVKDRQGNLYVSNAVTKTIVKYNKIGEQLKSIDRGKLLKPEALAVGDDGSVYVIDAGLLKLIRAHPE